MIKLCPYCDNWNHSKFRLCDTCYQQGADNMYKNLQLPYCLICLKKLDVPCSICDDCYKSISEQMRTRRQSDVDRNYSRQEQLKIEEKNANIIRHCSL